MLVEFDKEEVPLVNLIEELSYEQSTFMKEKLCRVKDLFCKSKSEVGCAKDLKLKLNLHDETPVHKTYVSVPKPFYPELKAYIEDLINKIFVTKSRSPYSSACVAVRQNGFMQ